MPVKPLRNRPLVALVGRTNVGKSTLWNRLTESGRALVSADPHTTRDRNFGIVIWNGASIELVDTGGMDTEKNEIGEGIRKQSEQAIREADMVLFVVDAKAGILPQDQELSKLARRLNKTVWLVANKVDQSKHLPFAQEPEFYRLGIGDPHPISAATGHGIGDLLDEVFVALDRMGRPPVSMDREVPLKLVLVGRPNVGKSSLVNTILGEERVIVSPIPHTTREPQDTWFKYKDKDVVLVDTAGMRKRSHIEPGVEEAGIERNEQAIRSADVAFLIFDVTDPPTSQDRSLAGILEESHKGLIIVANKWDLVADKATETSAKFERLIRQYLPFLEWAPLVFVSAKTGQRAASLLDTALQVQEERFRHIDYNALNRLLKSTIKIQKPLASYGPKSPRIYDVAQVGHAPPTFLVTVHGEKENVHPNWLKFFEKRMREKFGFIGTPIVVKIRHLPMAKTRHKRNVHGPGMEAVAGKIRERKPLVNQTRRRQKHGGHRY